MSGITKNGWSQLGQTAGRILGALLGFPPSQTQARRDCLARRYAACEDFAHCRYCSTVEQALRTAGWVERNWPHVQPRQRS